MTRLMLVGQLPSSSTGLAAMCHSQVHLAAVTFHCTHGCCSCCQNLSCCTVASSVLSTFCCFSSGLLDSSSGIFPVADCEEHMRWVYDKALARAAEFGIQVRSDATLNQSCAAAAARVLIGTVLAIWLTSVGSAGRWSVVCFGCPLFAAFLPPVLVQRSCPSNMPPSAGRDLPADTRRDQEHHTGHRLNQCHRCASVVLPFTGVPVEQRVACGSRQIACMPQEVLSVCQHFSRVMGKLVAFGRVLLQLPPRTFS
jgi:hypothetical protein